MDETEKYQQRLQAIAEKRRLQEEEDRARREMEDERLRLQQLKRKSLRDQWLMEGPPLSPTSLTSQEGHSPRSPLWGSQAQEIEKRIDELQTESQQLAEEQEKLMEHIGDGEMEILKMAKATVGTVEEEMKTNVSPLLEDAAVILTNGRAEAETDHYHTFAVNALPAGNGHMEAPDCAITATPPGDLDAERCPVPSTRMKEDDDKEDGDGETLVMRAERVIITDEEEDEEEEEEEDGEMVAGQPEGAPQLNSQRPGEDGEILEEGVKAAAETSSESEREDSDGSTVAPSSTEDGETLGDVKTNKPEEEVEVDKFETVVPEQSQSSADICGAAMAAVPIYTEAQLFSNNPAERGTSGVLSGGEAGASPEPAEAVSSAHGAAPLAGQFQEVPLFDSLKKQRTEGEPGEQEPLLSQAKAPQTKTQPAVASNTDPTPARVRADQGEQAVGPKGKSCQCCSVM